MKEILAERLLAKVLGWSPETFREQRPYLEELAKFKYNDYQQFSPGIRFLESLALWLTQFELEEERNLMYEFIRSRLIFISLTEIKHFISMIFPDYIYPIIVGEVDDRFKNVSNTKNINNIDFKVLLRKSLFCALSDGAYIDIFRRSNSEISNEQVTPNYQPSLDKINDMLAKLNLDLKDLINEKNKNSNKKFKLLFLLDDFSGSGISYFRKESDNFEGKIYRVLNAMIEGDLKKLFELDDLSIYIILYVASTDAINKLKVDIEKWLKKNLKCKYKFNIFAIQEIKDRLDLEKDKKIIDILKKYFDNSIIDKHYKKGNHQYPYLGFDQCGLSLILFHNTPNNSIPLLWYGEKSKYRGLFPRISRHKGES